jgi:HPt (histidine-containing phosphotransfer) domain-containing protein
VRLIPPESIKDAIWGAVLATVSAYLDFLRLVEYCMKMETGFKNLEPVWRDQPKRQIARTHLKGDRHSRYLR